MTEIDSVVGRFIDEGLDRGYDDDTIVEMWARLLELFPDITPEQIEEGFEERQA